MQPIIGYSDIKKDWSGELIKQLLRIPISALNMDTESSMLDQALQIYVNSENVRKPAPPIQFLRNSLVREVFPEMIRSKTYDLADKLKIGNLLEVITLEQQRDLSLLHLSDEFQIVVRNGEYLVDNVNVPKDRVLNKDELNHLFFCVFDQITKTNQTTGSTPPINLDFYEEISKGFDHRFSTSFLLKWTTVANVKSSKIPDSYKNCIIDTLNKSKGKPMPFTPVSINPKVFKGNVFGTQELQIQNNTDCWIAFKFVGTCKSVSVNPGLGYLPAKSKRCVEIQCGNSGRASFTIEMKYISVPDNQKEASSHSGRGRSYATYKGSVPVKIINEHKDK